MSPTRRFASAAFWRYFDLIDSLFGQTVVERQHVLEQRRRLVRQHRLDRHLVRFPFGVFDCQLCRRGKPVGCELFVDLVESLDGQLGRGLRLLPLRLLAGEGRSRADIANGGDHCDEDQQAQGGCRQRGDRSVPSAPPPGPFRRRGPPRRDGRSSRKHSKSAANAAAVW